MNPEGLPSPGAVAIRRAAMELLVRDGGDGTNVVRRLLSPVRGLENIGQDDVARAQGNPKQKNDNIKEDAKSDKSFIPPIPIMGGARRQGNEVITPWTGGKPNKGWNGLSEATPKAVHPTQFRPISIGSSTKAQHYRTSGMTPKFSRKHDLLTFQRKLMEHFESYGMDTVTYLPDPTDSQEMVSVVDHHARFTLKEAIAVEETQVRRYDSFDHENIRDAKRFLLNSLDTSLETQMYENCDPDDTFVTYWMNFVLLIGSISTQRFDVMKNRLKDRKLNNYPGQDVQALCSAYLSDYKELHGARMFDHDLIMIMVREIMKGGTEDFRSEIRPLKNKLDRTLMQIRHLSYDKKHRELVREELDIKTVLKKCKEEYRKLKDYGEWPAASHALDSKALNPSYGNMAANQLIHQGQGRDKSKDRCNNCGKVGHWERECPESKKGTSGSRPRTTRPPQRKGNPKGREPGTRGRKPSWPAPGSGESEHRKDNSGKEWFYCAKCKGWTKTHTTEMHKSRSELHESRAHVGMTTVNLDMHPAAFACHQMHTARRDPNRVYISRNPFWNRLLTRFLLIGLIKIVSAGALMLLTHSLLGVGMISVTYGLLGISMISVVDLFAVVGTACSLRRITKHDLHIPHRRYPGWYEQREQRAILSDIRQELCRLLPSEEQPWKCSFVMGETAPTWCDVSSVPSED